MEQVLTPIAGLKYIPGYLGSQEQDQLLAAIDQQPWMTDLKRRVQHYLRRRRPCRRLASEPQQGEALRLEERLGLPRF